MFIAYLNRKKAFTLIETVLALVIVSIISFMLLSGIKLIQTYQTKQTHDLRYRWQAFRQYMNWQLAKEKIEGIQADTLLTTYQQQAMRYDIYQNMIRKTSQKGGYEPLLSGVSAWHLEKRDNYVQITVVFITGDKYEMAILLP